MPRSAPSTTPFTLALNGIGAFEKKRGSRHRLGRSAPHEPLHSLYKKVGQALARVGVEPEQRAFMPHITLARLKRSSGTVGGLLEQSGGLISPPFEVEDFASTRAS
jgi:2'-5' RNA ligase